MDELESDSAGEIEMIDKNKRSGASKGKLTAIVFVKAKGRKRKGYSKAYKFLNDTITPDPVFAAKSTKSVVTLAFIDNHEPIKEFKEYTKDNLDCQFLQMCAKECNEEYKLKNDETKHPFHVSSFLHDEVHDLSVPLPMWPRCSNTIGKISAIGQVEIAEVLIDRIIETHVTYNQQLSMQHISKWILKVVPACYISALKQGHITVDFELKHMSACDPNVTDHKHPFWYVTYQQSKLGNCNEAFGQHYRGQMDICCKMAWKVLAKQAHQRYREQTIPEKICRKNKVTLRMIKEIANKNEYRLNPNDVDIHRHFEHIDAAFETDLQDRFKLLGIATNTANKSAMNTVNKSEMNTDDMDCDDIDFDPVTPVSSDEEISKKHRISKFFPQYNERRDKDTNNSNTNNSNTNKSNTNYRTQVLLSDLNESQNESNESNESSQSAKKRTKKKKKDKHRSKKKKKHRKSHGKKSSKKKHANEKTKKRKPKAKPKAKKANAKTQNSKEEAESTNVKVSRKGKRGRTKAVGNSLKFIPGKKYKVLDWEVILVGKPAHNDTKPWRKDYLNYKCLMCTSDYMYGGLKKHFYFHSFIYDDRKVLGMRIVVNNDGGIACGRSKCRKTARKDVASGGTMTAGAWNAKRSALNHQLRCWAEFVKLRGQKDFPKWYYTKNHGRTVKQQKEFEKKLAEKNLSSASESELEDMDHKANLEIDEKKESPKKKQKKSSL